MVVSKSLDREWFSTGEPVSGTAVWEGGLEIVSKITIYLEGKLRSTYVDVSFGVDHLIRYHRPDHYINSTLPYSS